MKNDAAQTCTCQGAKQKMICATKQPVSKIKQFLNTVSSIGLSVLIAFFPKCPLCLAAYMSMLGSIGLSFSPYAWWFLPLFIAFLGLHLWFMFKKVPQKGYLPFGLSLFGVILLLLERSLQLNQQWLLVTGVLFIFGGSMFNNFAATSAFMRLAAFKPFFLSKFQMYSTWQKKQVL
jgi:mercuric ion transport protein